MRGNVAFFVSLCLLVTLASGAPAAAQCDGIWWEYNDLVLTIHHDTEYNCGVFGFDHQVELVGTELQVDETALAVMWAWCQCPYATWIDVLGLAPGDYTLRFAYGESTPSGPPLWWDDCVLPLSIPATAARDGEIEFYPHAVGCGISAVAVGETPEPGPATWSTIKVLYR